jgi:hypothetical protein
MTDIPDTYEYLSSLLEIDYEFPPFGEEENDDLSTNTD